MHSNRRQKNRLCLLVPIIYLLVLSFEVLSSILQHVALFNKFIYLWFLPIRQTQFEMGCGMGVPARPAPNKLPNKLPKCFVVACMDFRFVRPTAQLMQVLGLSDNYDQFVLAGASLGLTQTKFPQWGKSLIEHMTIGVSIHHFREIIFVDHQDCSVYKQFYPDISAKDEIETHTKHIKKTENKLSTYFPNFKFSAYFLRLSGGPVKIDTQEKTLKVPPQIKSQPRQVMRIQTVIRERQNSIAQCLYAK